MRIEPTKFYDDEEERRRWELESMARFSGAQLDPSEFEAPELEQPDPDVERAAKVIEPAAPAGPSPFDHEMDAMRAVRDSYAKPATFWDDAAVPAIAGIADVLLNKGRGLGAIVAGGAQAAATRDAQRQSNMRQLAQMQLSMSDNEAKRAHNERMYGIQEGNLRAREAEIEEMRQRRLGQGGPDPLAASQANLNDARAWEIYNQPGKPVDPLEEKYKQAQISKMEAETAALRNPALKGDSPDLAYRKSRDAQEDAQKAAAQEAALTPIPGTKITNPEVWKRVASDEVTRRALEKAITGYRGSLTALDNLTAQRKREGVMALDRDQAAEYDLQKRAALGGLSGLAELGTLQKSDIELLEPIIPTPGLGVEDVSRMWGGDMKLDALKGARQGFSNMVDPRLSAFGIAYDYDFKPGAAPPPPADDAVGGVTSGPVYRAGNGRAQAAGAQPMPGGNTDRLPVTDQRRNEIPRVDDYLRRLQEEDDDLGVGYR